MVTPFSALGIVLPVLLPGLPQFVISKKCFPRFFPSFRAFFRDFRAQRKSRNSCTFDLASALLKCFFLQNQRLTRTADKKKGPQTADLNLFDGAPGRIRTHDPLVRSQVLYPTELLAHISDISASLFCEAGRIVSPGFDLCKSFLKISCKKLKLPQNSRRIGDPRILRQSRRQLC